MTAAVGVRQALSWSLASFLAASCQHDAPQQGVADLRPSRGPVAPTYLTSWPPPQMDGIRHSPLAFMSSGGIVDAKVLVITAEGTDAELAAITQTLRFLGTPFDVRVASTAPPLTATELGADGHGKYSAVILTSGTLSHWDGVAWSSAFSAAEWQALADYEAAFHVRRVSLSTYPDAGYGFSASTLWDTSATPLPTTCTAAGAALFPAVNCAVGVTLRRVQAYLGVALDADTVPLLVDGTGKVLAATRTYADGREALVLTFGQGPSLVHTLQLLHGVVGWANQGVFLGERHAYLGVQVDDLLLASAIYGGGTYRLTPSDLQAAADWQAARRAEPATAALRLDFAFNGWGSVKYGPSDPLTAKAQGMGPTFKWLSHTYSHFNMNSLSYAETHDELAKNGDAAASLGLDPFTIVNLITPEVTGLANPEAMRAASDYGVRFVVTDTSRPGYDNPTPNAGLYNPLQPGILMIPRRPTNLYYNVSTPAEWTAEYNDIYRAFWGRDLGVDEILDKESDVLVRYLLRGENDPWMFHQADLREYLPGRSLLSDLLDRTFDKYRDAVSVPVVSPTMDELGARVARRMEYDASGVRATIDRKAATVTIHVTGAATVPITGACGPTRERYAGETIGYVDLPAGGSVSLSLRVDDCPVPGGGGVDGGASEDGGVAPAPDAGSGDLPGEVGPSEAAAAADAGAAEIPGADAGVESPGDAAIADVSIESSADTWATPPSEGGADAGHGPVAADGGESPAAPGDAGPQGEAGQPAMPPGADARGSGADTARSGCVYAPSPRAGVPTVLGLVAALRRLRRRRGVAAIVGPAGSLAGGRP